MMLPFVLIIVCIVNTVYCIQYVYTVYIYICLCSWSGSPTFPQLSDWETTSVPPHWDRNRSPCTLQCKPIQRSVCWDWRLIFKWGDNTVWLGKGFLRRNVWTHTVREHGTNPSWFSLDSDRSCWVAAVSATLNGENVNYLLMGKKINGRQKNPFLFFSLFLSTPFTCRLCFTHIYIFIVAFTVLRFLFCQSSFFVRRFIFFFLYIHGVFLCVFIEV